MSDFSQCPHLESKWTAFTMFVYRKLTANVSLTEKLVILLLLGAGIAYFLWLVRRSHWRERFRWLRWRRSWTKVVVVLTVVCLLITSPPSLSLATTALTAPLPPDTGSNADAIVVLGRMRRIFGDRLTVAANLWHSGRAPKIFISGDGGSQSTVQQLKELGVPETALDGEACSMTTEQNARFTADQLNPQIAKRIILVTDTPHMLRSLLTFQSIGFDVIPHPSTLPPNLGYREKATVLFREYAGLISYGLKGRYFNRDVASTNRQSAQPQRS